MSSKCIYRLITVTALLFCFLLLYIVLYLSVYNKDFLKDVASSKIKDNYIGKWNERDNLVWFVQISDVHINARFINSRGTDLEDFCRKYINQIIEPKAVFLTGDIVDSSYGVLRPSGQHEEDWKIYYSILDRTNVKNKTQWLDLRGNHDDLMVPNKTQNVYYQPHNVPTFHHASFSYNVVINTTFGSYSFMCLDLTPSPGLLTPYNFYGRFDKSLEEWCERISVNSGVYNHTIWLMHYPISILSPYSNAVSLRRIARKSVALMFGHLHRLLNRFHGRDITHGNLLLELGDWKKARRFRVFAFDNDIFSFKDFTYKPTSGIFILITNPKNYEYNVPHIEPINRISSSSNIRALIFTLGKVKRITASIDNVTHCTYISGGARLEATYDGKVFTCSWSPHKLQASSIHTIAISVETNDGLVELESHKFTLDESFGKLPLISSIFVQFNMDIMLKLVYLLVIIILVIIPQILFYFPKCIISHFFIFILKAWSIPLLVYFSNQQNTLPLTIFTIINSILPHGCFLQLLPDAYAFITNFGIFMNGSIYYEPLVFFIFIQEFFCFTLPLLGYYFFKISARTCLVCKNYIMLKWTFLLLSEILWIISFISSLMATYLSITPIQSWITAIFNIRTYVPIFIIVVRCLPIKYSLRLHGNS